MTTPTAAELASMLDLKDPESVDAVRDILIRMKSKYALAILDALERHIGDLTGAKDEWKDRVTFQLAAENARHIVDEAQRQAKRILDGAVDERRAMEQRIICGGY